MILDEKAEAMMRQLYVVPEAPTITMVCNSWRDAGYYASPLEVRNICWNLPEEMLRFRRLDLSTINPLSADQLRQLYPLEESLLEAWRASGGSNYLITTRDLINSALCLVQVRINSLHQQELQPAQEDQL